MPKHRCAAGIAPRNLLFPAWLPGTVETLHPRRLLVNWHWRGIGVACSRIGVVALAWRRGWHWLVSRQPVFGGRARRRNRLSTPFRCEHFLAIVSRWSINGGY